MFAGCIAAAFWGNNVKFRLPLNNIRIYQALIGGIIAGFGARLGMGCNLAREWKERTKPHCGHITLLLLKSGFSLKWSLITVLLQRMQKRTYGRS